MQASSTSQTKRYSNNVNYINYRYPTTLTILYIYKNNKYPPTMSVLTFNIAPNNN